MRRVLADVIVLVSPVIDRVVQRSTPAIGKSTNARQVLGSPEAAGTPLTEPLIRYQQCPENLPSLLGLSATVREVSVFLAGTATMRHHDIQVGTAPLFQTKGTLLTGLGMRCTS